MCGRFAFYSPREAVTELFGIEVPLDFEPRYNIAPTQFSAVLRADGSDVGLGMLRWGLIPSWAKDAKIGHRLINARAETVHEKPAFRAAFRRRRCAVLADGYYEWRAEDGVKNPYFIRPKNGTPFAMAGLWERWANDAQALETFTIITTEANESIRSVHHRMPVILNVAEARRWINGDERDVAALRDEFVAPPTVALAHGRVSRAVNNPKNNGEELIARVD